MNEVSKANMSVYRGAVPSQSYASSQQDFKKSGHNRFAGYQYFELGDFLHPTLEIFDQLGLVGIVSFTKDEASLSIVDMEGGGEIVITSPFGSAALKGCARSPEYRCSGNLQQAEVLVGGCEWRLSSTMPWMQPQAKMHPSTNPLSL
jgi:hypothetical protein